ncbi:GntR family transcriptional regulator [Arcticibacter sp.]|jgi:GntR family transcriptional regulator/MocR family aminotransferase|uniref:GntR family transcriptional regulator n=1 Tax=Arcticibacter sp. TaxID=1872630 RepID=UPI00388FBBD6
MYSHWPLFWLPLDGEKNKATQIKERIIHLIESAEISPGSQVPPVTLLQEKLHVARSTVKRAYDSLKEEMYLVTVPGRGTFVTGDKKRKQLPDPGWPTHSPFSYCKHQVMSTPAEATGYIPYLCAGSDMPDIALLPSRKILNYYESGIIGHMKSSRYDSRHEALMKEGIQHILLRRDIAAEPDHALIIPYGHSLYMVVMTLGLRGKCVVMGSPADTRVQSVLTTAGAHLLFTGVDKRGMITDQLEKLCVTAKLDIHVVFVRSSGEFPSRAVLSEDRRRKLLDLALKYNFVIVAVDDDHEFWYKRALAPLFYRQHKGHIIHISPVSKLTLQFRMNELVIANRDFIKALTLSVYAHNILYDPLELTVIFRMSRAGVLDDGIRRIMVHYRQKLNSIENIFLTHLSQLGEIALPKAGFSLWITFRRGVEASILSDLLGENGFNRIALCGTYNNQLLNGLHLSFGSQMLESYEGLFLGMKDVLGD